MFRFKCFRKTNSFNQFIRACRKYKFSYVLTTCGKLELTLRPNDTFANIIVRGDRSYSKMFAEAIEKMKEFRGKA